MNKLFTFLLLFVLSQSVYAGDTIIFACKQYSQTTQMNLYLNDIKYSDAISVINQELQLFKTLNIQDGTNFKTAINKAHNDKSPSCLVEITDSTIVDDAITSWFQIVQIHNLTRSLDSKYDTTQLQTSNGRKITTIKIK